MPALVTAAAQGIGHSTAERFASAGANVWATDIDVRDADAIASLVNRAGPIDILFNCAGFVASGTIIDCTDDEWQFSIDLNVTSVYRTIRAVLPGTLQRGGGSIISMSSIAGATKGVPNRFVYGTTNAAVVGRTKSVAADFATRGIRCNAIRPVTIRTPSLDERLRATGVYDKALDAFKARQPMGRLGHPDAMSQRRNPDEADTSWPSRRRVSSSARRGRKGARPVELRAGHRWTSPSARRPRTTADARCEQHEPVIFIKATSAVSGPNDPIIMPRGSRKLDWEVDLAFVVGEECRYADEAQAAASIAGYIVCNDVSERAFQLERDGQWGKGKGCESFGPTGARLVTADEVRGRRGTGNPGSRNPKTNRRALPLAARINRRENLRHRQHSPGRAARMVPGEVAQFSCATVITTFPRACPSSR